MTRTQKLEWFAGQLIAEAAELEKAGSFEAATSKYLQAAEILLLLAKVEEKYTTWRNYTDRAAQCQQRVRRLIAIAPKEQTP